ncbi:G-type lectin S-receptor-like serine/threonine-protein kinase LECRK3 [Hevea brasiliensis]|uniref:G-type lectin S-receptor-like serine/threonine-protein kinase LECRK3 n=1 Tax=Hevea brasiliensis TaxID=3981 RepID=UPI0025D1C4A6|nr:G-type lectin S-receptor-like serine/threonine-protein kinase LECRK3 [Hevea brasiliensis]
MAGLSYSGNMASRYLLQTLLNLLPLPPRSTLTFCAPTDTILPGQSLLAGEELVSSISNTNHITGRFRLRMQRDGNLVMYPMQYAAGVDTVYWNTGTYTAGDNVSLNLDTDGKLCLLNATAFNIRTLNVRQTVFGNPIYHLTIDADGLFQLYSHNLDQNDSWLIAYQEIKDKCHLTGLCGLNSYCIPVDQDTACNCPLGFDFIDPSQENLDCKQKSSVDDCVSTNYTIRELESIIWESDSDSVVRSSNKTECRYECLKDCNCEATLLKNQECKKQKLPLRFGRTNEGESMLTLIKISNGEMGGKERPRETLARNDSLTMIPKNNKNGLQIGILVTGVTCSTFGLIVLAVSIALIVKHYVSVFKVLSDKANGEFIEDFNLRSFTYEELEKATNGFNERRSVSMDVPDDEAILAEWVYSCFEANELLKLFSTEEVDEQAL